MPTNQFNIQGLNDDEVKLSREKFGLNIEIYKKRNRFLDITVNILKEPMIILLLLASLIYFLSGQTGDALFLASAIVLVSAISLYQDTRSRSALERIKKIAQPHCNVIRNGVITTIDCIDIVVGDCLMVDEGGSIMADGKIIHSNDFSVNESILTGESFPVAKNFDNLVFKGTTVTTGLAIVRVSHIGNATELGKIGKSLETLQEEKTTLEIQIQNFVKYLVGSGVVVFILVWLLNFFRSFSILDSLLKALTLAMSILPEEIPMAFSAFMALGAWRLIQLGIVVKQMKTVESLGSATLICVDKTGTLTENKMTLARLFVLNKKGISSPDDILNEEENVLISTAMWASEPIPFDPMEIALHQAYANLKEIQEKPNFRMIHEYPLEGKPPMMTHIFENEHGERIIAAKGAPEAIMSVCLLTKEDRTEIEAALQKITKEGFRVLGVAKSYYKEDSFPKKQQELPFDFLGLVAFYDPPKSNIAMVLRKFYKAGIKVKIITGDNAATTHAIAKQVNFLGIDESATGEELMTLTEQEMHKKILRTNIFSRMFPEAKLRIVNAFKANGEIVAMVGDGVNDAPALKAAHIGIAMGKKGTEIAKQAASLILLEDDLSKLVDAIAMGRRIYINLKKAIQYIISIHIPLILIVFIPLALGWIYPNIFSPVHIIFFELIMGPTCSIAFENEPIEKNTMLQKPRPFTSNFFSVKELSISILQGIGITLGVLFIYQYAVHNAYNEALARTMVFTTLISANIFLTLVNRSFFYSIITTFKYKNNIIPIILLATLIITILVLYVPILTQFFDLQALDISQLFASVLIGFLSVIWFELIKLKKRINSKVEVVNENEKSLTAIY